MKPTQNLPPEYHQIAEFDLQHNTRLLVWLNVIGIVLLAASIVFFLSVTHALRPEVTGPFSIKIQSIWQFFEVLLGALVSLAGVLVLHEWVHGAFFWFFTRQKPKFGFKGAYAFAALPDWFIPRNRYLVVGLAPLVVITLAGIALIPIFPQRFLWVLLAALVVNASGAVGDLAVCAWLLFKPADTYAQDFGDAIRFWGR